MIKFAIYMGTAVSLTSIAAITGSVEALGVGLVLVPLAGLWASFKLYRWHQFYGTRFLWGLFLASLASNIASLPVAFIAIRRVLFPDADPFPAAVFFLGGSLLVLEGVFVYLVARWKDLDKGGDIESSPVGQMETRDQREDRQFGEQRRALESTHSTQNEREDSEFGARRRDLETAHKEEVES
jgi:hypothetical protein